MTTPPLTAKAEARLNKEISRRKATVSQAAATKKAADRQAALLKQEEALLQAAEKAERAVEEQAASAAASRTQAEAAAAELAKADASVVTMRKLLTQLEERKSVILDEHTAMLKEDERERALLSQRLQDHVISTKIDDEDDPHNPYTVNCRLRDELRALADSYDAKEKAHAAMLRTAAARAGALEGALSDAEAELQATAAAEAAADASCKSHAEDEIKLREACGAYSAKFQGFNSTAENSTALFGEKAALLGAASHRRRDALLDVRDLKTLRTLRKRELASLTESEVVPRETLLRQKEAALRKMEALRDTLQLELTGGSVAELVRVSLDVVKGTRLDLSISLLGQRL